MKRVLVFELNNYHTETFPVYENLLPSFLGEPLEIEYHTLKKRADELKGIYPYVHSLCSDALFFFVRKLQLRVPFFVNKINRLIKEKKADVVVFNSIEPDRNYKIFKSINAQKKIALVHNPQNIEMDKDKNEHYFVLNKILFDKHKDRLQLDGYMLPFFQQFKFDAKPKSDLIKIAIQGLVKFNRRDYPFLIDVAKELKSNDIQNIKFNIIGSMNPKDGKKLFDAVKNNNIEEYFIFHESLSDYEFFKEISEADFIMTLLHEKQKQYYEDKMTASFSHSASYNIPMILSAENAKAWDINDKIAVIYNDADDFISQLSDLTNIREVLAKNYSKFIDNTLKKNREQLKKSEIF